MKKLLIWALVLALIGLSGCAAQQDYRQISQQEAMDLMAQGGDYILLDVRTPEEYAEGHIPGAVNLPNEEIGDARPDALPDLDATVLVYCRSGRRSKEAAGKLARLGYTGILEIGGINTWPGEITTEETEASDMRMRIGDTAVAVDWEDNASVAALQKLTAQGLLAIEMSMYGGFEQVGSIGESLPREDAQTTTAPGDIVLYSGDQLVVFYGSNQWAYTRLGRITDQSPEALAALLGSGDVTITLE